MRRYRVSRRADRDLDDIADFIAEHNPSAAIRVIDGLEERFGLLAAQPFLGESCNELRLGLRRFVVGSYVVYYMPTASGIEVSRVLHGARDVEGLF